MQKLWNQTWGFNTLFMYLCTNKSFFFLKKGWFKSSKGLFPPTGWRHPRYPCRALQRPSPRLHRPFSVFSCPAERLHFGTMHAPCLTTGAMFIPSRKRTASQTYPLQTSPRLPLWLSAPTLGCTVSRLVGWLDLQMFIPCVFFSRGMFKYEVL